MSENTPGDWPVNDWARGPEPERNRIRFLASDSDVTLTVDLPRWLARRRHKARLAREHEQTPRVHRDPQIRDVSATIKDGWLQVSVVMADAAPQPPDLSGIEVDGTHYFGPAPDGRFYDSDGNVAYAPEYVGAADEEIERLRLIERLAIAMQVPGSAGPGEEPERRCISCHTKWMGMVDNNRYAACCGKTYSELFELLPPASGEHDQNFTK